MSGSRRAVEPVFYYIPDDGDQLSHPNVFLLPKEEMNGGDVSVGYVRSRFPLPGDFHFRFKSSFKKTFVWEDGCVESEACPRFGGHIFMKVSRMRSRENAMEAERAHSRTYSKKVEAREEPKKHREVKRAAPAARKAKKAESAAKERRQSTDDLLGIAADVATAQGSAQQASAEQQQPDVDVLGRSPSDTGSDLSDLGGLDFGLTAVSAAPMRSSMHQQNASAIGALDPVRLSEPLRVQSGGSSRAASNGRQQKAESPRSRALSGLMQDFNMKL
eukprot:g5434.t1